MAGGGRLQLLHATAHELPQCLTGRIQVVVWLPIAARISVGVHMNRIRVPGYRCIWSEPGAVEFRADEEPLAVQFGLLES